MWIGQDQWTEDLWIHWWQRAQCLIYKVQPDIKFSSLDMIVEAHCSWIWLWIAISMTCSIQNGAHKSRPIFRPTYSLFPWGMDTPTCCGVLLTYVWSLELGCTHEVQIYLQLIPPSSCSVLITFHYRQVSLLDAETILRGWEPSKVSPCYTNPMGSSAGNEMVVDEILFVIPEDKRSHLGQVKDAVQEPFLAPNCKLLSVKSRNR